MPFFTNSENSYTKAFKPWFSSRTYDTANNAVNSAIKKLQGSKLDAGNIAGLYEKLDAKFLEIRTAEIENRPNADPLNGIDVENSFFSGTLVNQIDKIERLSSNQKRRLKAK